MEWFRWYGGTFNDPKMQWVASKSCQPVAAVVAVWVAVLERAHDHEDRGCCAGLDFDSLDVALGLDDGSVYDIYQAMVRKAMIVDGDRVANWEKRQPKTEDVTATERKRNQRERERLQRENDELRQQILSQQLHTVTACHDMSRNVTTEESRVEEKRKEQDQKPTTARARVREVFNGVLNEKREVLVEKFPQCPDVDLVVEKLIAYQEPKGLPADPWLIMLQWFQKERGLVVPAARASPKTFDALKQERTIEAAQAFVREGYDGVEGSGALCLGNDRAGGGVSLRIQ